MSALAIHGKRRVRSRLLNADRFVGMTLAICLLLQRFALPFGTLAISVATPLVFLLIAWGLLRGVLTVERRRAACFCGLLAVALIASAMHYDVPLAFAPRISLNSLTYWLAITGFAIFRLREPMEEGRFFRIVNQWLGIVAIAGICEFIGQFVGLRLFSFTGLISPKLLIEHEYAVVIPLEGSGILRSNGFFLVEPSVFSQFMAVGIIIEWLCFRRLVRLGLFFAALLVSISGTGWLVLIAFLLQSAFTSGVRGSLRMLGLATVGLLALVVANFVLPEVTGTLFGRVGEFSETGSSGYARFITPVMALSQVLHEAPWTFFTGLGPGAASNLLLAFKYWLNTPVKVLLEYGVFGLIFYLSLLLVADRTRYQTALVLPLLVLLMFTGGYQEFSPILFPVLLITSVAFLRGAAGLPVPGPAVVRRNMRWDVRLR
jgi:hypothetical protein